MPADVPISRYERPWEEGDFGELVVQCITIIGVALSGKEHDQPGKPEAGEATENE